MVMKKRKKRKERGVEAPSLLAMAGLVAPRSTDQNFKIKIKNKESKLSVYW